MGLLNSRRLRSFHFASRKLSVFDAFVKEEFGVIPSKKAWYEESMTHASLSADLEPGQMSNERLEFLGDAVLGAIIAKEVFDHFPHEDEGPLTQRKAAMVSRRALNQIGKSMKLDSFIEAKLGRSAIPPTVIGNALEALLGAIFIDKGYRKTELAVRRMFDRHGAVEGFSEDFKTKVQEWAQRSGKLVEYNLLSETMVAGRKVYEMELLVEGEIMGTGRGSSKKGAEHAAAEEASSNISL